jgi:predicted DNA-binding transcriptional regulator AlpA
VRRIFYQRTLKWARQLAESAPAEVLQEALSSASARGTIVHVLGKVPVEQEKSEEETLLEQAQERALVVQEQLRREAGGLVSTQEVVNRTGLSRQTVDRYRKEGKLLALETAQGFQFPLCQFYGQAIVPGLDEVLAAMEGSSFWETLSGLITPTPTLNNRSVLDALRDGPPTEERAHIVSIAYDYANE